MISPNDLNKLYVLMQRATLQASEAEDYVALKFRVEQAIETARNPPPPPVAVPTAYTPLDPLVQPPEPPAPQPSE